MADPKQPRLTAEAVAEELERELAAAESARAYCTVVVVAKLADGVVQTARMRTVRLKAIKARPRLRSAAG